jgi:hypothetical protein
MMGMAMKDKYKEFVHDFIAYIAVFCTMAIMVVCFLIPQ